MCGRKTCRRSPPAVLSKIPSPIWYFQVGQPDRRKVLSIYSFNFEPLANPRCSRHGITRKYYICYHASYGRRENYPTGIYGTASVTFCRELINILASTPRNARWLTCHACISSYAPHLWPPLLRLPCLSSAMYLRAHRQMGP
jgi:hypothetical protein